MYTVISIPSGLAYELELFADDTGVNVELIYKSNGLAEYSFPDRNERETILFLTEFAEHVRNIIESSIIRNPKYEGMVL